MAVARSALPSPPSHRSVGGASTSWESRVRLARRLVLDHIVIIELASRAELAQQAIALEQAHTTSRSGNRMPRAYVAGAARSPPATGSQLTALLCSICGSTNQFFRFSPYERKDDFFYPSKDHCGIT